MGTYSARAAASSASSGGGGGGSAAAAAEEELEAAAAEAPPAEPALASSGMSDCASDASASAGADIVWAEGYRARRRF